MFSIQSFSSRESKKNFLQEIIEKLSIQSEEKELYMLSLEVLEDSDFNTFFEQVHSQVSYNGEIIQKKKIAPFTTTLF